MKSRRHLFSAVVVVLSMGTGTATKALTTANTDGPMSNEVGAHTIDFGTSAVDNDSFIAGVALPSGNVGGVNYSYSGGALFNYDSNTTTFPGGISARPVGSVDNYWSIGIRPAAQQGPGIVSFDNGVSYYGFLWGSPDTYNKVGFYNGSTLLGSFDGSAVLPSPNGNQAFAKYFNVYADAGESITRVEFYSGSNAFETDNHAFIAAPVPEPEIYAMMAVGMGVMGWAARRKKRTLRL